MEHRGYERDIATKAAGISEDKVKVLFVGGRGRSGSTLLDLMLGQTEGFFSVGELRYIWERGLERNELCGCGKPFKECGFWGEVLEQVFGRVSRAEIGEIKALQSAVDRMLYIPKLFLPWSTDYRENLAAYSQILSQLYQAIRQVSGSRVIIDSSKLLSHGFILSTMPDIDLHFVHLVRDSRAAAYSWQRKRVKPEVYWEQTYQPRFSLAHSSLGWNVSNVLGHLLGYRNGRCTFVRYEDLASNPREALSRILAGLGEGDLSLQFLKGFEANLDTNHTVAGNPLRFTSGKVRIQLDSEWREKMGGYRKLLVTALTWPFLLKYGYLKSEKHAQD